MELRFCVACGKSFQPHPQVAHQTYCSSNKCQSERKRKWQREKLKSDADYRDNQTRAQDDWRKRNPNYWKTYRELNIEYAERNRRLQRSRNKRVKAETIAKMDEQTPLLSSGIYRLIRVDVPVIAKSDEWIVEINILSSPFPSSTEIAKR